jgi:hypothetical protein
MSSAPSIRSTSGRRPRFVAVPKTAAVVDLTTPFTPCPIVKVMCDPASEQPGLRPDYRALAMRAEPIDPSRNGKRRFTFGNSVVMLCIVAAVLLAVVEIFL